MSGSGNPTENDHRFLQPRRRWISKGAGTNHRRLKPRSNRRWISQKVGNDRRHFQPRRRLRHSALCARAPWRNSCCFLAKSDPSCRCSSAVLASRRLTNRQNGGPASAERRPSRRASSRRKRVTFRDRLLCLAPRVGTLHRRPDVEGGQSVFTTGRVP